VLAGGRSRRMGFDKTGLWLCGRPLVEWPVSVIKQVLGHVWLVGGDPELAKSVGALFAPDIMTDAGPLGGIYSALGAAKADILVVACDMPLIQPAFLRGLLGFSSRCDVVVPVNDGKYEPLIAIYRQTCLPAVEQALASGRRRVASIYEAVEVCTVPQDRWALWDPGGMSFVNVNTPTDLELARTLLKGDATWRTLAVTSNA